MEMPKTLFDLVNKSGDSELDTYCYKNGVLNLQLKFDELDSKMTILINTDIVKISPEIYRKEIMYSVCRLELIPLETRLDIKHGIYIPSANFGKMMEEINFGLLLAYGKKVSEAKYLMSLVGYGKLISCMVKNIDDVSWIAIMD